MGICKIISFYSVEIRLLGSDKDSQQSPHSGVVIDNKKDVYALMQNDIHFTKGAVRLVTCDGVGTASALCLNQAVDCVLSVLQEAPSKARVNQIYSALLNKFRGLRKEIYQHNEKFRIGMVGPAILNPQNNNEVILSIIYSTVGKKSCAGEYFIKGQIIIEKDKELQCKNESYAASPLLKIWQNVTQKLLSKSRFCQAPAARSKLPRNSAPVEYIGDELELKNHYDRYMAYIRHSIDHQILNLESQMGSIKTMQKGLSLEVLCSIISLSLNMTSSEEDKEPSVNYAQMYVLSAIEILLKMTRVLTVSEMERQLGLIQSRLNQTKKYTMSDHLVQDVLRIHKIIFSALAMAESGIGMFREAMNLSHRIWSSVSQCVRHFGLILFPKHMQKLGPEWIFLEGAGQLVEEAVYPSPPLIMGSEMIKGVSKSVYRGALSRYLIQKHRPEIKNKWQVCIDGNVFLLLNQKVIVSDIEEATYLLLVRQFGQSKRRTR